ncbi:hypothetical protein DTW90_12045 [Neorhizobium sp. P12A]|nr:hypothetical protein DTW90_12045 [Neorhizobium sp. P12A]
MIIPFPMRLRGPDIRRCAKSLMRLGSQEGAKYFRREVADAAALMRSQGVNESRIAKEVAEFSMAVQLVLRHLHDAAIARRVLDRHNIPKED